VNERIILRYATLYPLCPRISKLISKCASSFASNSKFSLEICKSLSHPTNPFFDRELAHPCCLGISKFVSNESLLFVNQSLSNNKKNAEKLISACRDCLNCTVHTRLVSRLFTLCCSVSDKRT